MFKDREGEKATSDQGLRLVYNGIGKGWHIKKSVNISTPEGNNSIYVMGGLRYISFGCGKGMADGGYLIRAS